MRLLRFRVEGHGGQRRSRVLDSRLSPVKARQRPATSDSGLTPRRRYHERQEAL